MTVRLSSGLCRFLMLFSADHNGSKKNDGEIEQHSVGFGVGVEQGVPVINGADGIDNRMINGAGEGTFRRCIDRRADEESDKNDEGELPADFLFL